MKLNNSYMKKINVIIFISALIFSFVIIFYPAEKSAAKISEVESSEVINKTKNDSLYLKIYIADRDYFLRLQETEISKNQYIGLQWCIDLLNKYIAIEEKRIKDTDK